MKASLELSKTRSWLLKLTLRLRLALFRLFFQHYIRVTLLPTFYFVSCIDLRAPGLRHVLAAVPHPPQLSSGGHRGHHRRLHSSGAAAAQSLREAGVCVRPCVFASVLMHMQAFNRWREVCSLDLPESLVGVRAHEDYANFSQNQFQFMHSHYPIETDDFSNLYHLDFVAHRCSSERMH